MPREIQSFLLLDSAFYPDEITPIDIMNSSDWEVGLFDKNDPYPFSDTASPSRDVYYMDFFINANATNITVSTTRCRGLSWHEV